MSTDAPSTSRTAQLAEYVAGASFDDLPGEVVEAARRLVLDSLTNMIGGSRLEPGQLYLKLYEGVGGRPESTILATGERVPCPNAVYVNASLANVLDFDDVYFDIGHPGATIVPPAVGVGEKVGASGKELLAAVVAGYEVSLRVCDALLLALGYHQQVPMMATWQTFGATAAAASLLKLDPNRTVMAFGHAALTAPVPGNMGTDLPDRPVSELKHHYGWAAMGGVRAAELAALGLRGHRRIFDATRGYWSMISTHQAAFERLTSGLGSEYLTLFVGLKAYTACRQTHAALDAAHELMADPRFDPRQVARVVVEGMPSYPRYFDIRQPADVTDAEFTIPPLVALTLAGHSPKHGLAFDRLGEPLVQDIMSKLEVRELPDAARVFDEERYMPATVRIEQRDGTRLEASVGAPTGEHQKPMSWQQVIAKYREVTEPIVGPERSRRILERVERLETLDSVADLAR